MPDSGAYRAQHTVESIEMTVDVARIFRLRRDHAAGVPRRLIAHIQARYRSGQVSVFGQVDVSTTHEEAHAKGSAWRTTESLLDNIVGRPVADGLLDSALAAHSQGATDDQVQETSPVERLLRSGADVIRHRPLDGGRNREPTELLGLTALRLALEGALAHVTAGDREGSAPEGSWFVGDLDSFYEEHIDAIDRSATAPAPAAPHIGGEPANSFPDAPYIEPLPKDGTKGHLLEREALRYGLSSIRFPNGTFVVSDDSGRQMNFKWGRSPIASGVALSICSYKEATRRLLDRAHVAVPSGQVFTIADMEKALDYADRIGYPVVCKPVAGLRGIGVIADIPDRQALVRALDLYTRSELGNDDLVIEEHVPGQDYRIVVIAGEVVAAVVREPASVIGDGVHTVADLVEYKNRARRNNPHLSSRPIKFSDSMRYQLARAGLTLGSVPGQGQKVVLANSANLSQGGDSFEVGHELHPSLKEAAVRAVEAVPGLGFCGLDMLIEDHTKPITSQRATVIELNAHAAIGSAQYPMWGKPTPVAQRFFQAAAASYGITLPRDPHEQLSVEIVVRGRVVGVGYRRWLRQRARRFGVSGVVANTGPRKVTARLNGHADAVAALVYLAASGPPRALPSSVTTTHVPPFSAEGFTIEYQQLLGRRSRLWSFANRIRRAFATMRAAP